MKEKTVREKSVKIRNVRKKTLREKTVREIVQIYVLVLGCTQRVNSTRESNSKIVVFHKY